MKKITIIFLISMITSVSKGQVNSFDGFNGYDWNTSISEFDFISDIKEECKATELAISEWWVKGYIAEIRDPIEEKYSLCWTSYDAEDYAYVEDIKVNYIYYDFICDKEKKVDCKLYSGRYVSESMPTNEGDKAFEVLSDLIDQRYDIDNTFVSEGIEATRLRKIHYISEDSFIEMMMMYNMERYDRENREIIYDKENLVIDLRYNNYGVILDFEEYIEDFIRRNRRIDLPL